MHSCPTLSSAFSHLACALRSAPPFVRLVTGDDQHMARLWDRACLAESTGSLRIIEEVQDAQLRWCGSMVGVVIGGRSGAAAFVSTFLAVSFV